MAAPSPLILICDHLGEGLSELLGPMSSVGYRIEHSNRFSTTLDRLARGPRPNVVVVDPLARGGSAELEEITRLTGPDEVPILLISDPASPLRAVHAARSLGNGPWDIVHRDAPIEEILLRIDRLGVLAEGKAELEEMRFRAVHDDRTELLRPVPFITRLREHFSAPQRHRPALGKTGQHNPGRRNAGVDLRAHEVADCCRCLPDPDFVLFTFRLEVLEVIPGPHAHPGIQRDRPDRGMGKQEAHGAIGAQ